MAADLLNLAGSQLQAGRLDAAEASCRLLVRQTPNQAEAWHLLGIVLRRKGDNGAAIDALRRATALDRKDGGARFNLGNALRDEGQLDEAVTAFREAVRLMPAFADGWNNLGVALRRTGRHEEAAAALAKAIALAPENGLSHLNLADVQAELGQHEGAIESLLTGLRIGPQLPDAYRRLGDLFLFRSRRNEAVAAYRSAVELDPVDWRAWTNLSVAYRRLRVPEALRLATEASARAVDLEPDSVETLTNYANALFDVKRYDEALAVSRRAVERHPHADMAQINIGRALQKLGDMDGARAAYDAVRARSPENTDVLINLSLLLCELGDFEAARAINAETRRINPHLVSPDYNDAFVALTFGDFDHGWTQFELRWLNDPTGTPFSERHPKPAWSSTVDATGKRVFLWWEQGLGDTIQFARYAQLIKQRGASEVIVSVHDPLVPLLVGAPGIDVVLPSREVPAEFDFHVPLMSIPLQAQQPEPYLPPVMPYLKAPEARRAEWRGALDHLPGLKVGIAWSGNPDHPNDRHRSIEFETLRTLLEVPGVSFVRIQPDIRESDRPRAEAQANLHAPPKPIRDFADTAALFEELDLIISVDTSVVHLAGALGRPAWVLLAVSVDYRWLLEREDSLWYPSLRLYRQTAYRDWTPLIARVARDLAERAAR